MKHVMVLLVVASCASGCSHCNGGTGGDQVELKLDKPNQSCAGFPDSSRFITGRHPRYPGTRYITAGAVSCKARSAAENWAQKKVAAQINSHISGMFKMALKQWASGSGKSSRVDFIEDITSTTKVVPKFNRGHLIKVVDSVSNDGAYGALAALNRKNAVAELEPKVVSELSKLQKVLKQCDMAYDQGRLDLLRAMYGKALKLAAAADEPFRELCFIAGNVARYQNNSPWLSLEDAFEKKLKLTHRRRWYVHVGSSLAAAAPHAQLLEPVVANTLRKKKLQVDRVRQPGSGDVLKAMRKTLGKDRSCLSFAVTGSLRGRVSSVAAGQGQRLHICVCTLDLTGKHVASGRTLFQLTVSGNNGGGENNSRACQECVELLQKPLQNKLAEKIKLLDL